jgi:hypothetical protein
MKLDESIRAARKPGDDKRVTLPVRLSKETHARLMAVAEERMVHSSVVVERALVEFLATVKPVAEEFGPAS